MKAPANNQIVVTNWSMQVLGIGGGWIELPTIWIGGALAPALYHALGAYSERRTAPVTTRWASNAAADQVLLTITIPNAGSYTVVFDATTQRDLLNVLVTTQEQQIRLVLDGMELPSDDDSTEESEYPYYAKYGLALHVAAELDDRERG